MQKILLCGCNGRMGRAVSDLCAQSADASIVAGLDIRAEQNAAYPVYTDLRDYDGTPDVVLDFSSISALAPLLSYAQEKRRPLVLATTGYNEEQLSAIRAASASIPLFQTSNMSLGVNVLLDLVRRACAGLGAWFDVEIIEKHHNQKIDAPSGTALSLYEAVSDSLPRETAPVYCRANRREKRTRGEVGLHSIRGGSIVGEHVVLFAGHHETIELKHSAASREVFAAGALRAAVFMANATSPGLYGMADLLK